MTDNQLLEATPSDAVDKGVAIWEIASVTTSALIAQWVVLAFAGQSKFVVLVPILLALALMIISHLVRGETLRNIGFRFDNFGAACKWLLLPTAITLLAILLAAWLTRNSVFGSAWRSRFFVLPVWALFQQYTLNGFINRRAQMALGTGVKSVLLVGLIFSLLHFPHTLLAVMTFVGGLIWAAAYQRHPNLFALALSHSVISITLALTISPNVLNSLRVGFKYFG